MEPPYDNAQVGLGKAVIDQMLTYDTANAYLEIDKSLKSIHDYVSNELGHSLTAEYIIYHLGYKFNYACGDAMRSKGIPYLGHSGNIISTTCGFPSTSKPLRDPVAFINSWQLFTYLKENKIMFSRGELLKMISTPTQN